MANLNPHQQFGLSSLNSADKTVIMVKLTDSAHQKISEHIAQKNLPLPTIQFSENFEQGHIYIPNLNSAITKYHFDVKNNDNLQHGLEVIQQYGSKSLKLIGNPQHKLCVNATEDIYEKTKVKLHILDKESKKCCTKELKGTGQFDMSNRVKTKRNFSSMSSNSNPIGSILPQKLNSSKPLTPPPNRSDANHSNGKSISTSNGTDKNNRPIKDRIIHLLALKPYNKSELILRLQKDGMKEAEKKVINQILSSICNLSNNSYTLSRTVWAQIQDNWPYYTPEEQETVSKRKKQQTQAPYQAETSPVTTTSPSLKRPHPSPLAEPPNKRNCFKSPEVPSQTLNPINSLNSSSVLHNQPLSNGIAKSTHSSVVGGLPITNNINNLGCYSIPNSNGSLKHMNGYGQNNDRSKGSFSSPEISPENSNDSLDSQGNNNPPSNYRNHYGTINTQEERSKYKEDFNQIYDEYLELHTYLSNTSSKFNELRKKRHSLKKDTDARIKISKEIKSAYKEKESKYTKKLERFKYLHKKLEYIKNLVTAYDNSQL